jgi:hypothetical protein
MNFFFNLFYFIRLSIFQVSLWAIGAEPLIHGTLCILLTFIVTRLFKGSLASTIFLFVFHIGYLVVGYVVIGTDSYDISWTMPHCVMTLRLIGLAMDVFDGQKKPVCQVSLTSLVVNVLIVYWVCFRY